MKSSYSSVHYMYVYYILQKEKILLAKYILTKNDSYLRSLTELNFLIYLGRDNTFMITALSTAASNPLS